MYSIGRRQPIILFLMFALALVTVPLLSTVSAALPVAEQTRAPLKAGVEPSKRREQHDLLLWRTGGPSSDATPPTSNVLALPAYSRSDVTVRWTSSGDIADIEYFDIQYRIGQEEPWQDWILYTSQHQDTFAKMPGETVYFRSRATGTNGQQESWPDGDGDAFTTFYNWAITGKVMDNRLVPVAGVAVATTQQVFENNASQDEGDYSAYFDGYDAFYHVDYSKSGYGSLPTSSFPGQDDAYLDVLLPPADNIVTYPGFESSAALTQTWGTGGLLPPFLTDSQFHSGEQSAFLGSLFDLEQIAQFDADPDFANRSGPKQDDGGRLHLVWYEGGYDEDKNIYYRSGDDAGNWSQPIVANPSPMTISTLLWDVSPGGIVHIVWDSNVGTHDNIYHLWKDETGWHGPALIYNIGWVDLYALRADSQGGGHLLWHLYNSSNDDGYYSYVSPTGDWSSPDRLFVPYDTDVYNLVLDREDVVHLQWTYSGDDLLHNFRLSDGSWSERELVAPGGYNWYNDLLIDDNNGVHLVWGNVSSGKIFHSKRQSDGTWSTPSYVSGGTEADPHSLKASTAPGGSLVLGWLGGSTGCRRPYAAFIDSEGVWTTSKRLLSGSDCVDSFWFNRTVQYLFLHTDYVSESSHNFCVLSLDSGSSQQMGECTTLETNAYGSDMPYPLILDDGLSHVFWRNSGSDGIMELIHTRTRLNQTPAESHLWQKITLPTDLSSPTLSFAYWQSNAPFLQSDGLQVLIDDGDSSSIVFSGTGTSGWQYQWVDLSQWSGTAVTVRFELAQVVGERAIWSYIDEVYVGSAYPDSWLDVEVQGPTFPGSILDLVVAFGNKSTIDAVDGEVTLTLPPDLIFVESSPDPTSQNGELAWDVGTLSHSIGEGAIEVRVQISDSLGGNESLQVLAVLNCATEELEVSNNAADTAISVNEPATAAFTATPTSGVRPLEVRFTNDSSGDFTRCLWDFGDDSVAEGCQGPAHIYSSGSFTAALSIDGPGGTDTIVRSHYITVYEPAVADFEASSPTSGIAPLTVDFMNLTSGDYDQCLWDFGDGITSDVCDDLAHTYDGSGTYAVTLTVDGRGGESSLAKEDYIVVYEPVVADFTVLPEQGAPPLTVDFTNLSTGDFSQCLWDFGDGRTLASCEDPTYEYKNEGRYEVALTVNGVGGESRKVVEDCITVAFYRLFFPGVLRE